jgi:hypothetical protein
MTRQNVVKDAAASSNKSRVVQLTIVGRAVMEAQA